ncbi:hypothetical protein MKW94_023919 [Papaver nudicaule]|uniref:Uncharacterized protein n=1 Tax=Papaver nudicaule TaxID=74823 RepID=A0AA41RZE5_PAPNU|nr:hypothetical protein [Papaver nudicaule]
MAKSIISKIFSATSLLLLMIMISYTAGRLLDLDVTKADVGHNGNIVKVKPTRVSVLKKGHGIADVQHGRITVGKNGRIADVTPNTVSVRKKGHPTVDTGKVQAHILKGH